MNESDLIDVGSLDLWDDQTWLYRSPKDLGEDAQDWAGSITWPVYDDEEYQKLKKEIISILDEVVSANSCHQSLSMLDKHKFDSRTYVRPKKKRPTFQKVLEANWTASRQDQPVASEANKYLTYNKYSAPPAAMMRLKTFNVDERTDGNGMRRTDEEDPQLQDDVRSIPGVPESPSAFRTPSKPINICLSQPAPNLVNTLNKGVFLNGRGNMDMEQSGEYLMRVSPPSLVSSILLDGSGNFHNMDTPSLPKESGVITSRESMDAMATSMTLSILDEKEMSTSFLSQATPNDSFIDSSPPSLVSSVNSSYVVSSPRIRTEESSNIFSSATFTQLDQSEKLLSARPRHQMYHSFTKREVPVRSESYTKAREEACQIDTTKVLNENSSKDAKPKPDMFETITLHYSNNKFRKNNDSEKENLNESFDKTDDFYKLEEQRMVDLSSKKSLDVTMDKQELNEIIQARQKLSLARRGLPIDPEKLASEVLPNQIDVLPKKSTNQTVFSTRKSLDSDMLIRNKANRYDKQDESLTREPPKRHATFKKIASPRSNSVDTAVVYVKDESPVIDINSATLNLIGSMERNLMQEKWGSQEQAMVGSSESTDTATFSSSSPPDSVPDTAAPDQGAVASTPFALRRHKQDHIDLHATISPIYNMVDEKSYTVTAAPNPNSRGTDLNSTLINNATMVKKGPRRDIQMGKVNVDKKMPAGSPVKTQAARVPSSASYSVMPPPSGLGAIRKTNLPASKLRQYSSHRELRAPAATNGVSSAFRPAAQAMVRRNVYASNPALFPGQSIPVRQNSYTIAVDQPQKNDYQPAHPVLANPPSLVRQGTETLRRERPKSQLVQPKDQGPRPNSVAGAPLRSLRPASGPAQRPMPASMSTEQRPASGSEARSGLPRPSRLPAPPHGQTRRALRPPSVYSVAPPKDVDHY